MEEAAQTARRRRRVVDTDVELTLYGLEDADGTLGVTDQQIRDAMQGMTIWIHGHHFVLYLRNPTPADSQLPAESYFWEDEIYHE